MRTREYISYSQLMLVESSPERYVKKYVYGEDIPANRAQLFGKTIADALETGEPTGDPTIDLVVSTIPNSDIKDKDIIVDMNGIPVLIKPDGLSKNYDEIIEHKTGPKGSWNQKKADNWDQITFYCMGIHLLKGKIPKAKLVHIITENDGEYYPTGEIKVFKTTRTYKDILIMMSRVKRAWEKIEKIITEEL